jgi:hypothetical protein
MAFLPRYRAKTCIYLIEPSLADQPASGRTPDRAKKEAKAAIALMENSLDSDILDSLTS